MAKMGGSRVGAAHLVFSHGFQTDLFKLTHYRQLLATTSTRFCPSHATASRMTAVSPRRHARLLTAKQRREANGCTSSFLIVARTQTFCGTAAPHSCGRTSTRRYSNRSRDSGTGSVR
jgi:hypothetical protein